MILRQSTVIRLPAGTVVNVAGTVSDLRLTTDTMASMASDEPYASMGDAPAGLIRGAYVETISDSSGVSTDGSTVSLPSGTYLFVVPGTVVALVSKATEPADRGVSTGSVVGIAIGTCVLGLVAGWALGRNL